MKYERGKENSFRELMTCIYYKINFYVASNNLIIVRCSKVEISVVRKKVYFLQSSYIFFISLRRTYILHVLIMNFVTTYLDEIVLTNFFGSNLLDQISLPNSCHYNSRLVSFYPIQ